MDGEHEDRRLSAARKQSLCLSLRARGLPYRTIAERVGFAGPSGAHKAVMAALDDMLREPTEHVRQLELERLDYLWNCLMERVSLGDAHAVNAAVRVMERRARLLGLDAPSRGVLLTVEVEDLLNAMPPEVQAAVRSELAQLAGGDGD